MSASPFKFLDSYERADIASFFGRERETADLFRQCFVSPILVVYGGSGTGKTSLVQCGLASRFQESDWLPIPVRRSGDMLASVLEAIRANTLTESRASTLNELAANLYLDHFKPLWFIFDQFEELFIFGTHAESETFFTAIGDLLATQRNARAIFIVREEYLAELTRYERIIPGLIENRYRVERLSHRHAMDVVEKLCAANQIPCGEGFSAAMVERLDPEGQGVELSYLQVFLDRCWRSRQGEEPFSKELLERIGHVDDLLGAFLDEQVADTPDPQRSEALLKTFVSDQGTKRQLTSTEAHEWVNTIGTAIELSDVERLLQVFVTKRLLKDRDERGRYELLHDALARQIFQRITRAEQELIEVRQFVQQAHGQFQKRGVKLTANDLAYLRPYRTQLHLKGEVKEFVEGAFGEEERRERRKKLRTRILLGILVIACLAGGKVIADTQKRLARERAVNESSRLAEAAMELSKTDPYAGYLVAERAFRTNESPAAERAILHNFQLLQPIIARFKGNDLRVAHEYGRIIVADWKRGSIAVYDTTGALVFERKVNRLSLDNLKPVGGGRFLLVGESPIELVDLDGALIHRFSEDVEMLADLRYGTTDSSFWAFDRDRLILWQHGASQATTLPIDTLVENPWLRTPDNVMVDEFHRLFAASIGDTLFVSSIVNNRLELVDSISLAWFSQPVRHRLGFMQESKKKSISSEKNGSSVSHLFILGKKLVAVGRKGIIQVSIERNRILRREGVVHFDELGISFKGRENGFIFSWLTRMNFSRGLIIRSEPNCLYSFQHPGQVFVPPVSNYMGGIIAYDDSTGTYAWRDYNGGRSPLIIASVEGFKQKEFPDIEEVVPYGKELLLRLVSESKDLRIKSIDLAGDSLWGYQAPLVDPSLETDVLRVGPAAQRLFAFHELLSLNEILINRVTLLETGIPTVRLLTPGSYGPSIDAWVGNRPFLICTLSDSVYALVRPDKQQSGGMPSNQYPYCQDSLAFSYHIENNTLFIELLLASGSHLSPRVRLTKGSARKWQGTSPPREYCRLLNRSFAVWRENWPIEQEYLVDLRSATLIDTGSFAAPSFFYQIPGTSDILRVAGQHLIKLNARLQSTTTVSLSDSIAHHRRLGSKLVVNDDFMNGRVLFLDLASMKLDTIIVPLRIFDNVQLKVSAQYHYPMGALDKNGCVVYVSGSRIGASGSTLYAIRGGRIRDSLFVQGDASASVNDSGQAEVLNYQMKLRSIGGGVWGTNESSSRKLLLKLDTSDRFVEVEYKRDTIEIPNSGTPTRGKTVTKNGFPLISVEGNSQFMTCGDALYTSYRLGNQMEVLPLDGNKVIRLVREEMQFGEFWKQLSIEPVINTVLGTDAYNASYSIGSLLRSTWVKLGLLLGAGALAYAWWSRRQRLRAA